MRHPPTQTHKSSSQCIDVSSQHTTQKPFGVRLSFKKCRNIAKQSLSFHIVPFEASFYFVHEPSYPFPLSCLLVSKNRICKAQKNKMVQKVMQRPQAQASWRHEICLVPLLSFFFFMNQRMCRGGSYCVINISIGI